MRDCDRGGIAVAASNPGVDAILALGDLFSGDDVYAGVEIPAPAVHGFFTGVVRLGWRIRAHGAMV
jgi:hypothetical protein